MHALFIAMRRLQPDLFSSNVKPYLQIIFPVSIFERIVERIGVRIEIAIEWFKVWMENKRQQINCSKMFVFRFMVHVHN